MKGNWHEQFENLVSSGILRALSSPPEVLVWQGRLDLSKDILADLARLLDPSERIRAATYGPDDLKRRFVARRALLRMALGHALGVSPETLCLKPDAQSKPCIPDSPLHFNASSSHESALIAISSVGHLGIDIEQPRSDLPLDNLANDYLTAAERSWVAAAPPDERQTRFLTLWTRKEACAKSLGTGLTDSLTQFEAPYPRGDIAWTPLSNPVRRYSLRVCDLAPESNAIGAVALAEP